MPIVNLTNLTVRIEDNDGSVTHTFEPADQSLTVRAEAHRHDVDGVEVEETAITHVDGLPEPEDGTFYIVPQSVAYTVDRPDFVTPDIGPSATRDEQGQVYAVQRLLSIRRA